MSDVTLLLFLVFHWSPLLHVHLLKTLTLQLTVRVFHSLWLSACTLIVTHFGGYESRHP